MIAAVAALAAARPGRSALGAHPAAGPADHLCNPVASRQVEPRVVGAAGTVNVRVAFNYHCHEAPRPVYFFLVVENSRSTDGGRTMVGNLREGLTNFVNEMDYGVGSQGGLILYHSNVTVQTPTGRR